MARGVNTEQILWVTSQYEALCRGEHTCLSHRPSRPGISCLHCGAAGKLWGCSLLVNHQPLLSWNPSHSHALANHLSRLFQILCRGQWGSSSLYNSFPSPKALMCPEQIAAEGISFLDLCQTTFYLIPSVLLCREEVWLWPREQTDTQKRDRLGKSLGTQQASVACPMRVSQRTESESSEKDGKRALQALGPSSRFFLIHIPLHYHLTF